MHGSLLYNLRATSRQAA